jgi:hypothetical protein
LKLSTGALEFPLTEMQEKAQALCHIDLLWTEWDEAEQRETRLKNAVHEVYTNFP